MIYMSPVKTCYTHLTNCIAYYDIKETGRYQGDKMTKYLLAKYTGRFLTTIFNGNKLAQKADTSLFALKIVFRNLPV